MYANVVLLKKLLDSSNENTSEWLPRGQYTRWETMGHFDEIYIYPIEITENFMDSIKKDKDRVAVHNSASVYYHPLYMISDSNNNPLQMQDKWYCAIVRIHFGSSLNLVNQFSILSKDIVQKFDCTDFSVQISYGSEFSDMVLEVYGSDLSELVKSVLELRQHKYIGKMYTYFGINYDKIFSSDIPPTDKDNLDFFSMRFPGTDMEVINEQLQMLSSAMGSQPVYCVTGVDDILIRYTGLKSTDVVGLFRNAFIDEEGIVTKGIDSTIRVGITVEPPLVGGKSGCELKPLCDSLLALLIEIDSCQSKPIIKSWWLHVSELSKALARMSTMPVMDEVVYLLAPGIRTFLVNILSELKAKNTQLIHTDMEIHCDFIEHCFYLMEQLMRLEGQLSQQPEIRPVIYDIPVFMLEYTLAFLNEVCETLQRVDSQPNAVFDFLLVPHSCPRIEALELFSAIPDMRHGLVQIEIPTDMMYHPHEMLRALCHEISHYVGEKFRLREERKKYYSTAAAATFASLVFNLKDPGFTRLVKETFLNALESIPTPTISMMSHEIELCTSNLLLDEQFDALIFKYLTRTDNPEPISRLDCTSIDYGRLIFRARLQDINTLFQEVYADICMFHLLNLNADDYIGSLLQELAGDPPDENTISYETFAVRIYTCLYAVGKEIRYSRTEFGNEWEKIQTIICNIKAEIVDQTDGEFSQPYPIASIYALRCYAEECYTSICDGLPAESTRLVYEMYSDLTKQNIKYDTILSRIGSCRDKMLRRYSSV